MAAMLLGIQVASGQDLLEGNTDGHGRMLPAASGRVDQPLTLYAPEPMHGGDVSVGVAFEHAYQPLARFVIDGDERQRTWLLHQFVAANLGARVALSRRIGLSASIPAFPWVESEVPSAQGGSGSFQPRGPALGDLHVQAPVMIVAPPPDSGGLSLAAMPYARFPTGTAGRFLSDRGPGAGISALASGSVARLRLTANAGAGYRGVEAGENLRPGLEISAAAGAGYTLSQSLGAHLEVRAAKVPGSEGAGVAGLLPTEAVFGLRGRPSSAVWWSGGLGTSLIPGVGSARLRTFVGVGFSRISDTREDVLGPEPMPLQMTVRDPDGQPIQGARLFVGGMDVAVSNAQGQIQLPTNIRWSSGVEVRSEAHQSIELRRPESAASTIQTVLPHLPVPVSVSVRDQSGAPVEGDIRAEGSETWGPQPIASDGVGELALVPGEWVITTSGEGFGTQRRSVSVVAGEAEGPVEVLMLPEAGDATLALTIADRAGTPLEGISVRIDGSPVGQTGSGGKLVVEGLEEGPHTVEAVSVAYGTERIEDLVLDAGETSALVGLRRLPGSVLVEAMGPDGPATDVLVRFDGPSRLAAAPLGEDGSRIFPGLQPGTWDVWALSSSLGIQRRTLVIEPNDTRLLTVSFQMQPSEGGLAELRVAVVDPDGRPLEGVALAIDGIGFGATASGGSVEIAGLQPGSRALSATGERLRPRENVPVYLSEGPQESTVVLEWLPGTVWVRATSPEGPVVDGTVRFSGPSEAPGGRLDTEGTGWFTLGAGDWQVVVISASHGLQSRGLTMAPSDGRLSRVNVHFPAIEAGGANLSVRVVGPAGDVVPGASVSLDGADMGTTSSDGVVGLTAVKEGSRVLRVSAPGFEAMESQLGLVTGDNSHEVKLRYAPSAVRLRVLARGEPVSDAMVRVAGPAPVAPIPVDKDGTAWLDLPRGDWLAVVISPSSGIQQRSLSLDGRRRGPHELLFELQPVADVAEVLLRVEDPDGQPVEGALVRLAGRDVETGLGGTASLSKLEPGVTDLAVTAATFQGEARQVELREGPQERIVVLEWLPQAVGVTVTDAADQPVPASLTFDGPEPLEPIVLPASGKVRVALRPGEWKIIASADGLGSRAATVVTVAGGDDSELALSLGEAKVEATATEVRLLGKVQFDLNESTLRPESDGLLSEVAATLLANPSVHRLEVQGHTDPTGENVFNLALSENRAEAVVADLIRRGVAPERLIARGYGSSRPLAPNDSEEGRSINRRVEFRVLKAED